MRTLLFVALVPWVAFAYAPEKTTVQEILSKPDRYHGKDVTVTDKIFRVQRKISRVNKRYFVFRIGTEKRYVNVYGNEYLDDRIRNGDTVSVTGAYMVERRYNDLVNQSVYRNEIDCTSRVGSENGVKRIGP